MALSAKPFIAIIRPLTPVILVVSLLFSAETVLAKDFDVYIATYEYGRYLRPPSNRIIITRQPTLFYVVIENISSSAKTVGGAIMGNKDSFVKLEVIDEDGKKTIIEKERERTSSSIQGTQYIRPGELKAIEMVLDPGKWKNIPLIEPGVDKYLQIRAIVRTDYVKETTPYYEVILKGRHD